MVVPQPEEVVKVVLVAYLVVVTMPHLRAEVAVDQVPSVLEAAEVRVVVVAHFAPMDREYQQDLQGMAGVVVPVAETLEDLV